MIRQGQALSLVRGNMRRKHQTLIGMAVLTLVMTSRSAVAQEAVFGASLQPRIVEGEAQKPPGTFYIGGYSSPGGTARYVVHFYSVRDPADRRPEGVPYVSIPIASRSYETTAGTGPQEWTDGRTCAALYGVMYEFTRLAPPLFHTPRFTPEPEGSSRLGSVPLGVHAPIVSVWGYARQADGAPMSMMLTGTDGIIDRWVRFAEDQLADCWRPGRPTFEQGPVPATQSK